MLSLTKQELLAITLVTRQVKPPLAILVSSQQILAIPFSLVLLQQYHQLYQIVDQILIKSKRNLLKKVLQYHVLMLFQATVNQLEFQLTPCKSKQLSQMATLTKLPKYLEGHLIIQVKTALVSMVHTLLAHTTVINSRTPILQLTPTLLFHNI